MFEVSSPRTGDDLVEALGGLHLEIVDYLSSFSTEEFLAPQGRFWSPEGHLRHLIKSVRPVAEALRIPKPLLALRFGTSRDGSRSFDDIREIYRSALAAGADAGRYGPSKATPAMHPDEWRQVVMDRWNAAGRDLTMRVCGWSERALDRYRLPHPLIGKLTIREMLFFTLYHNGHHARRIQERVSSDSQKGATMKPPQEEEEA